MPNDLCLSGRLPGGTVTHGITIKTWELDGPPWLQGLSLGPDEPLICPSEVYSRPLVSGGVERDYEFEIHARIPMVAHVRRAETYSFQVLYGRAERLPPIVVTSRLEPAVAAVPGELLFALRQSEPNLCERKILLVSNDPAEWSVRGVSADVAWLKLEFEPERGKSAPGESHTRTLRVQVERQQGDSVFGSTAAAQVRVELNHAEQSHVNIPVTVTYE